MESRTGNWYTLGASSVAALGLGALVVLVTLFATAVEAEAKLKFRSGAARYELTGTYCVLGTTETMVGGYAAAQMDLKRRRPRVGQVFYVRLAAHNPGLLCGGEWSYADIGLPPQVRPAISRKHPIRVWVKGDNGKWKRSKPVTKRMARYITDRGWVGMNPAKRTPWPMPHGIAYRFDLPVKAKKPVSSRNGCACLIGAFTTSSGVSRPEGNWSFSRRTYPLHGPYGPLRVFPR